MYRIKDEVWEDFKINFVKYGFHKVGPIYEYVEDYLNGKLWVYDDKDLVATHYLDNIDRRTKIIKQLINKGLIEKV